MADIIQVSSDAVVISGEEEEVTKYYQQTEKDKNLLGFIVDHTDQWRDYRDQNYSDDWDKYERIFRGKWAETDKTRKSERSKIISPATQQAVETRHAEIMEAIFGNGKYFDIKDDLNDENGTKLDVEKLKNQLEEDFAQDKIRKGIENITLLAEIYGIGIGEIVISYKKQYKPMQVPVDQTMMAYGTGETERLSIELVPVNPKNFIFDPNGVTVDDCMGVAIEKSVSIHKIAAGIADGKYRNVDITSASDYGKLEPTQEKTNFDEDKVTLLTYYGLIPRKYIDNGEESDSDESGKDIDDYEDMVEAIVVVANDGHIIKAEISPYMMKDRPIVTYQADTVPNRLIGRGTCEKAFNMQSAIDGSMRSHMDSLALTSAPMMGMDSTRLPRGAKFEVKPGGSFMTNGNPAEILFPFKFGMTDGQSMETSKEFERMLLMSTGTIDSSGNVSQVSRDGNLDMSTATIIKKYKRTLINFQEDFLIPFIYKAAWRRMQFDPERYPAVDVKFIPTAMLGLIAREYEQKQLAFLIQTLGANSPLTPVLMQGIISNSGLSNKEEMLEQMAKMSQPDPQQQQMAQQVAMLEMQLKQADAELKNAQAHKAHVEAELAPRETQAKVISALSNNLDEDQEGKDFERRVKLAELMLSEEDIRSNERIAIQQMASKNNSERVV
jgi:hypothetical protein